MNIRSIGNDTIFQSKTKTESNSRVFTEPVPQNNAETISPLEYYKNLCKDYPDITFRLNDRETDLRLGNQVAFGYNGSLNQVGEGFGKPGQCSIDIDVAVIRHMQSDEAYETRIRAMIEDSRNKYSFYEDRALRDGFFYVCVVIEEEGGEPLYGVANSRMPFSTEEELKEMWKEESLQDQVYIKYKNVQDSLVDQYLKMLEDRDGKLSRLGIE